MVASALMLGLTFFSFIIGWYMMGVVIILFSGVYMLYEINSKQDVHVQISEEGIQVDRQLYEMAKVREFGVIYIRNQPEILRVVLTKKLSPHVDLFLPVGLDVLELRNFLAQFAFENENLELGTIEHLLLLFRV